MKQSKPKPHLLYDIYWCEKCGFWSNEISGKRYSDGDIVQWCGGCGGSDDHIVKIPKSQPRKKKVKEPTFNNLRSLLRL